MVVHFTTALEEDILAEKKEQHQKNTTFVFSAVNIIFIPFFIPFMG